MPHDPDSVVDGDACLLACLQDDERLRNNRLVLLKRVASLPKGIAELSMLPGF